MNDIKDYAGRIPQLKRSEVGIWELTCGMRGVDAADEAVLAFRKRTEDLAATGKRIKEKREARRAQLKEAGVEGIMGAVEDDGEDQDYLLGLTGLSFASSPW